MDEAWFEKLQAIDDEFAKQLGLLSMVWADTEAELYQVLRHYAGVSEAVARALFGGSRARDFINSIGEHYADIVTAGMLADMVYDLYGIVNHLNMHWTTGNPKFSPWEEDPGERTTWRYKSPQPADLNYGSEKGQKKRS